MKLIVFLALLVSCGLCENRMYQIPLNLFKARLLRIVNSNIGETQCAADLKTLVTDLAETKLWALKMVDSTSKILPGVLEGNLHFLGDYDECLEIREEINGRLVEGQYCTAIIALDDNFFKDFISSYKLNNFFTNMKTLRFGDMHMNITSFVFPFGLCVPKSCSVVQLKKLLNYIENVLLLPMTISLEENRCVYEGKSVEITMLDVFIYCFFITVVLVLICSTLYDGFLQMSGLPPNILTIFSVYSNFKTLITPSHLNPLSCIHGIKVIACTWIVFAHLAAVCMLSSKNAQYIIKELKYSVQNTFYLAGFYMVDTFFTITSFLVTYIYLKYTEMRQATLFNYFSVRLIRLIPPLWATVFMTTSILHLVVDGPYGTSLVHEISRTCHKSWWRTLLFINNYIALTTQCVPWTWYLAVDMHLYIISPIMIFFLRKYPRRVLTGMLVTFWLSLLYIYMISVVKKLGFTIYEVNNDYLDYLYLSTIPHLPCFLMGIALGFILYYNAIQISSNTNKCLWIVSLYIMYKLIVGQLSLIKNEYNAHYSALWNTFAKPLWSLVMCFIIYSCATGQGGVANRFLSHPFFRVLSKLTYCIYLIHCLVFIYLFASMRDSIHFENSQLLSRFCGSFIIIVLFSIPMYLAFEAPLVALKDYVVVGKIDKNR